MATTRPFAYNNGSPIAGTDQVGQLAVGTPTLGFGSTGLQWWNGPDEELGYVIAKTFSNQPTPVFKTEPLMLSSTYKPVDILLNNGNKTAYVTNWSYTQTVLSDTLIDKKDKVMFSLTFSSTSPGVMFGAFIGVGTRSMDYNGPFGGHPGTDNQSVGFSQDGSYYYNGAVQATGLPTWISGSTIDIAIDLESGNKIWIRVNGGNWNNNPSDNPETGVCSLGMGGLNKIYPALCPGSAGGSSYGSMTLLTESPYGTPTGFQFLGTNLYANVKFLRSSNLTDQSFIDLVNSYFNQNFLTATLCKNWLTSNGYWTSWGNLPAGMVLYLDAGLTSSYPGSGSTWYDLSGYNNNGTFAGGATYSSNSGGTLVFDGINSSITFNNPVEIPIENEPYTISVWFNSDEMPSNRGFVGWGAFGGTNQVNAWRLRDTGSSGFRHYWWGNDLDYTTPMSSGTWYNAVAAYSNGSRKLYLNNVQVAEDFPTGHNVPYSTNLRIGVTADFLGEWFDGKIAQVVIYKRQATTQEIESIWNSGKSRFGY